MYLTKNEAYAAGHIMGTMAAKVGKPVYGYIANIETHPLYYIRQFYMANRHNQQVRSYYESSRELQNIPDKPMNREGLTHFMQGFFIAGAEAAGTTSHLD